MEKYIANVDRQAPALYIVSGATDSMGSLIARRLAEQGKPLLLASRNLAKAEDYAEQLRKETRNKDIQCLQLDLNSFELVKDFVERLKTLNRPIAVLVNNAGTLPRKSSLSPNGYEHTVQVNFLSTVLLSMLVSRMMAVTGGGRIVLSTSVSRRMVSLPYEFPAVSHFTQIGAYAQSKLALTLFSIYMATRMRSDNVHVNCVNPGVVKAGMIAMHRWIGNVADFYINHFPSPEAGVTPTMRALESNDTGLFFEGEDRVKKTTAVLTNREEFIKVCNDTMRIIKKYL